MIANEDSSGCRDTFAAAFISYPHGGDSAKPALRGEPNDDHTNSRGRSEAYPQDLRQVWCDCVEKLSFRRRSILGSPGTGHSKNWLGGPANFAFRQRARSAAGLRWRRVTMDCRISIWRVFPSGPIFEFFNTIVQGRAMSCRGRVIRKPKRAVQPWRQQPLNLPPKPTPAAGAGTDQVGWGARP
jgi:hypothetical protein